MQTIIDGGKMNIIKTLITERDFDSLRLGKALEFEYKEENIKVVLKYLKDDKFTNPANR